MIKEMELLHYLVIILDFTVWLGKVEGAYIGLLDTVVIYIFSQTDDKEDIQSKQLYSLHALSRELRHRWQKQNNYKGNEEDDADQFATQFINKNSRKISKIMSWDDEWEVEEE